MALEALDFAFGELGLAKLSADVLATNARSESFHRKVGFSEEGNFREQHFNGKQRIDVRRFGMLASEWPGHCSRLSESIEQTGQKLNGDRRDLQMPVRQRLLFTGGGGAGSEALLRLLSPEYEVFFADADPHAKPFPIAAEQWHQIPFATDPRFVEEVTALCQRLGIDLLVPGVDEELLPLARILRTVSFDILLPSVSFVERHLDKLTSNEFLRYSGLPVPQTKAVTEGRLDFPCIVKPRSGRGSRNVATVFSENELNAHIVMSRLPQEAFIVQQLIIGHEYTVMMVADKDAVLRAVVPVFVETKKGITLRAHTIKDSRVISACVAIHSADPVSGCYNIQLIKTAAGDVLPFEINPRISTTSCLGLAAGVNFVAAFLESEMPSESNIALLDFHEHVHLSRSWHNEITFSK